MSDNRLTLTCWGGIGSVTGANFLLEGAPGKFLIDCGLVQGGRFCEEENYAPFQYDPASVKALLVTHSHLDHIGRIPKLVRDGFRGVIYSTLETREIAELILDDALSIMEHEEKIHGMVPLYSRGDIATAMSLWKTVGYHEKVDLSGGLSFRLKNAGHILGSAMIEFHFGSRTFVCTGDLGNSPSILLPDTESIAGADYLLMESVYGDSNHEPREERDRRFLEAIRSTIASKGALVIPAFSLERTQDILYVLNQLVGNGVIPSIPVFVDSPLAIKVTEIYRRTKGNFNAVVSKEIQGGDDVFNFPRLSFTMTREQSDMIDKTPNPKIIIAGSGMSAGGRVTRHEKVALPDKNSMILLVGYQSLGTVGRMIENNAKTVTIDKEKIPVRAKIEIIRGFSSHKDSDRLVAFVGDDQKSLKKVFVAMGEPKASLFLVQRLRDTLSVDALYPQRGVPYELQF